MANICFVSDSQWEMVNGVTRATASLALELKARGHNVIFFAASYPNIASSRYHEEFKTYRFCSICLPKTNSKLRLAFAPSKLITQLLVKNRIDVVHSEFPSQLNAVTLEAAKKLGIFRIVHSHHQPENWLKPIKLDFKIFIDLSYKGLIWMYQKANIIICPSRFSADIIQKYSPTSYTSVITNGTNIKKFYPKQPCEDFYKKFKIPKSSNLLLSVGRFAVEKNHTVLIRALAKIIPHVPNVFLILIGTGPAKKNLINEAKRLKVSGWIKIIDGIDDDYLVEAYNACSLFIHPSFVEMEGLSTLEAMSCEKPILVANSIDSATPIFVHECNGKNGMLFEPTSEEDLSQKIITMLNNKEKLKLMGNTGYNHVIKNYNISTVASKIEALYPHPSINGTI